MRGPRRAPAPAPGGPASVEGVIQVKGRFGFVLSEVPGRPDLFVSGPSLQLAMDGDRVRARVLRPGPRPEGEIVAVLSRRRATLVGVYRRAGGRAVLAVEGLAEPVQVAGTGGLKPADGDLCVLRVTRWPEARSAAAGELIEVLGRPNEPATDLRFLLRRHELPHEFPAAVEREAAAHGDTVPASAWAGRRAFFDVPVFTIDGADAKDFDDAVSLERRPSGWRLGVHIADVAHYVREGSGLDAEARSRGTSVYLVGAVVPMLPFPLSDNLCSLLPHVPRLTLSCLMDLDKEGRVTGHRLMESVIRSRRRFTYEEVEELLGGRSVVDAEEQVRRAVADMGELARRLRERRVQRGSLDFDFPEPEIVVDDRGWPVDAKRRERGESHRLIEEFMLLANETVARSFAGAPFVYRVHGPPDPAKMADLEKTLRALGLAVPPGIAGGKPAALQRVLAEAKGKPAEPVVNILTLRSLKQAVYSPVNIGHFGLASAAYAHFTSPIRRYPDLLVHRIVKERLAGRWKGSRPGEVAARLPALTAEASARERAAVEAEREFLALKRAQLMSGRLGEEFDALVTGVTSFGVFVQPTSVFVEGLVSVETLPRDGYEFDPARLQLKGRRTGRTYRVGQALRVRLAGVNLGRRTIDFVAVDSPPGRPASRR